MNGSSVFAGSGFGRTPAIVRIVVVLLISGGRLAIPAVPVNDSVGRTPDSLCPARQATPVCWGNLVTAEAGRKSLAAEHAFSRKASFSFVTTGKAARCRRPWDRSSFRIVRLRGGTFLRMRFPCYRSLCYGVSASVERKTDYSRCRSSFGGNGNLRRCTESYSGMLPCFLGGLLRILLCAISRA